MAKLKSITLCRDNTFVDLEFDEPYAMNGSMSALHWIVHFYVLPEKLNRWKEEI